MRVRSVLEKRQFLNAAYHREIPFSGQIRVHFQFDKYDILPRPERRVVSKIKTSPKRGSDVSTIADVSPFIKNTKELDIWSTDYFLQLADMIKFE